jgi:N-acetylglucosaminyldiphosphoundecaprenol N-acetyl-beta-D-mannosaminyltransferase
MTRDYAVLLDVAVDRKPLEEAIADAMTAIERDAPCFVFACANPHSLVTAQFDTSFKSALNAAGLVVADGVGVTVMAKVAGVRIGPRITGTDFFNALMHKLQQRARGRVFFFGSSPEVLGRIAGKLRRDFPDVSLCGALSPPYGNWSESENRAMVDAINRARPDVLWVGMTAPKQEKWVEANRTRLQVPVIASVGGVFDFYAGTHARAPRWMRKIGCEWLYRLLAEPRRMWRRTLVSAPQFVFMVVLRHVLRIGH